MNGPLVPFWFVPKGMGNGAAEFVMRLGALGSFFRQSPEERQKKEAKESLREHLCLSMLFSS